MSSSEGNLITAKEKGEQTSALNYDDQSNLTSVRDVKDNLYEYGYDDSGRMLEEKVTGFAKDPEGEKRCTTL